jgi:F-type H+-transporting ATPase subunit a
MPDPIHQFEIKKLFPLNIGSWDVSFTNSSLFMLIIIGLVSAFLILSMRGRSLVPTRLQSIAETTYEFIAHMVREHMGEEGIKLFPLVFTIFIFILGANVIGLFPTAFTITSHLSVTAGFALLVFVTVLIVGFAKNGLGFLKLFVPDGVPMFIMPLVSLIEVVSFLSRPVSHSVRLFANMMAGHVALKVFAGFIIMLLGAGGWAIISPLPLLAAVALMALEFLVAFLQAYVFAILTCMYLSDALHPGH